MWIYFQIEYTIRQHVSLGQLIVQEEGQFQWACSCNRYFIICSNSIDTKHIEGSIGFVEGNTESDLVHDSIRIGCGYIHVVGSDCEWSPHVYIEHELVGD